jgi:hypothetical protein
MALPAVHLLMHETMAHHFSKKHIVAVRVSNRNSEQWWMLDRARRTPN